MSCSFLLRNACLRGLLTLAISLPLLGADQRLLSLIPSDADAVIGANVRTILDSGLVQELMREAGADATQSLDQMIRATGMDPRRDISEVMVAGFSPEPGVQNAPKNNGLVFVSGNFDPERIGSLMVKQGGSMMAYKGKTLWVPAKKSNPDKDMLTFLDAGVLVAGSEKQVKRFIDGGLGQLSANLKSKVNDVSGRYDLWMVSAASPTKLASSLGGSAGRDAQQMAGPMQGEMLEKIESVKGGLKFGPQMLLGLEMDATTAEDATALMNVLQFFKSMLAGSSSGKGGPPAGMQKMLGAVEMRTESKTLLLSMSMAEQDVVEFLRSAAKQLPSPSDAPSDEPGEKEEIRVAEPKKQKEEIIIIQ